MYVVRECDIARVARYKNSFVPSWMQPNNFLVSTSFASDVCFTHSSLTRFISQPAYDLVFADLAAKEKLLQVPVGADLWRAVVVDLIPVPPCAGEEDGYNAGCAARYRHRFELDSR